MNLTTAQLVARIKMLEAIADAREVAGRLPATCDKRPVLVELRRYVGRQR